MKTLNGCTVLLTGASAGLGKFMARALAERGVKLALTAHPGVELRPLCQEVEAKGSQAVFLVADLRDPARFSDNCFRDEVWRDKGIDVHAMRRAYFFDVRQKSGAKDAPGLRRLNKS